MARPLMEPALRVTELLALEAVPELLPVMAAVAVDAVTRLAEVAAVAAVVGRARPVVMARAAEPVAALALAFGGRGRGDQGRQRQRCQQHGQWDRRWFHCLSLLRCQ